MDGSVSGSHQPTQHRSACAECQRRKQKCNREWPCNHCQKRKVADKCRFNNPTSLSPSNTAPQQPKNLNKKRSFTFEDDDEDSIGDGSYSGGSADELGLEALGYMAGPLLSSLTIDPRIYGKAAQVMDYETPEKCPPLKRALDSLPQRPQMDALVQEFFNNVNYHYYIIYPPTFLEEYQQWWDKRSRRRPLSLQWTALLIMVCSCATQHLNANDRPKIELDMRESTEELTENYRDLARELSNAIPVGHYHLLNVQRMLHAIYWYKSEARFVEAWHLIGAAVREAQELGLHKESASEGLPEFEREMRRRVWCILDTWDWQFASGLCRPTLIDHTDVDITQPSLALENFTPSPLLHMKSQSEAIAILAARFGAPKNVQTPAEIQEYKGILETWMRTFPPVHDINNPDTSKDEVYPWIVSQRFYLHTMAYLMILNPIRTYMAKSYTRMSPSDELRIRADGVNYSLRNLDTTTHWTEHVHHRDGRFHFIIFSLFDTASVLVAAVLKDEDDSMPRKSEVLIAVEKALVLLKRLNAISKTAKTSYDILSRLVRRLPRPSKYSNRKRAKISSKPAIQARPSPKATISDGSLHQYGSESTSPSALYESNSSGSTPLSHVATPESAPPSIEPTIQENIAYNGPGQQMAFGSLDPVMNLDGLMQPMPSFDGMMPSAGIYTGVETMQFHDPYAHDPYMATGYEEITDTQLGDFSRLWDWQSLGLDFISSESAELPPAV